MEDTTRLPDIDRARSLLGMTGAFEGVARWPWMVSGMGTDDAHTPLTNRPRHSPQRVVEKVGRSITNSETPHLHRGGDRQLNRAIHIIALGRIAWDPETRAYIERRLSDGKTKREALRCLKRHIARQIWHLLYNTQPISPAQAAPPTQRVSVSAPALMPCTR